MIGRGRMSANIAQLLSVEDTYKNKIRLINILIMFNLIRNFEEKVRCKLQTKIQNRVLIQYILIMIVRNYTSVETAVKRSVSYRNFVVTGLNC